jgi:hypothetical protein
MNIKSPPPFIRYKCKQGHIDIFTNSEDTSNECIRVRPDFTSIWFLRHTSFEGVLKMMCNVATSREIWKTYYSDYKCNKTVR